MIITNVCSLKDQVSASSALLKSSGGEFVAGDAVVHDACERHNEVESDSLNSNSTRREVITSETTEDGCGSCKETPIDFQQNNIAEEVNKDSPESPCPVDDSVITVSSRSPENEESPLLPGSDDSPVSPENSCPIDDSVVIVESQFSGNYEEPLSSELDQLYGVQKNVNFASDPIVTISSDKVENEPPRRPTDNSVIINESPESPPLNSSEADVNVPLKVRVEPGGGESDTTGISFSIDKGSCGTANTCIKENESSEVEVLGCYSKDQSSSSSTDPLATSTLNQLIPTVVAHKAEKEPVTKVPIYSVDTDSVLLGLDSKNTVDGKDKKNLELRGFSGKACFNCDGNHVVTACPKPKDPVRINQRRNQYMASRNSGGGRYHERRAEDKFSNFKPGVISPQLKQAMGLKEHDIAMHIYLMRLHGFPPGYLQMAVEPPDSGLKIYGDETGNKRKRPPESSGNTLNIDKLIDYPGFTSPPPPGTVDQGRYYGLPYSDNHSLSNLCKKWNEQMGKQTSITESKDDSQPTKRLKPTASVGWMALDVTKGSKTSNSAFTPGRQFSQTDHSSSTSCSVSSSRQKPDTMEYKPEDDDIVSVPCDGTEFDDMAGAYNIDDDYDLMEQDQEKYENGPSSSSGNYHTADEHEKKRAERDNRGFISPRLSHGSRNIKRSASPSLLKVTNFNKSVGETITNYESDDDVMIIDEVPTKNTHPTPPMSKLNLQAPDGLKPIGFLWTDLNKLPKPASVPEVPLLLRNPLYKGGRRDSHSKLNAGKHSSSEACNVTRSEEFQGLPESMCTQPKEKEKNQRKRRTSDERARDRWVQFLREHAGNEACEENNIFTKLPPAENFARGMPELPLQEESLEFPPGSRLEKVLNIVQSGRKPVKNNEDDDDIQVEYMHIVQ